MLRILFVFSILAFVVIAETVGNFRDESPSVRALTPEEIKMSDEAGYSYVDRLSQLEEELHAKGQYVKENSPFHRMAKFKKPSETARELSRKAARMLEATRFLKNQMRLTNDESGIGLQQATSRFSVVNDSCLPPTTCSTSYKYRTIDGSCNNLNIPNLGKSNTVYRRLNSPSYADGIEAPRMSDTGSELPNTRFVSTVVFGRDDNPLTDSTLALMQWGQFINHDFQSTPQFISQNGAYGSDIRCCTDDGSGIMEPLHPACLVISVRDDDPFFPNVRCINFIRSMCGPRLDCSLGYADQLNQNTHWLDASTVYGSENMNGIRAFVGGKLLVSKDRINRDLLPTSQKRKECTTKPEACFNAGDSRATEQPQLTVMHTIWMREHNRIANILSSLNPSWKDESIFQEARRIVIAEMQHITYNEFIPNLLDARTIKKYRIYPLNNGLFSQYNNILASGPVSNEFSTAAFRMGHSLVQGYVRLYDENGNVLPNSYRMSDTFFDASKVVNDVTYLDGVIRGLLTQPSQSVDQNVDDDLWNQLFKTPGQHFGMDIVALNIQRGRDHGLPGYNSYREFCGFRRVGSFDELEEDTPDSPGLRPDIIKRLAEIYESVDDVDLFVGGLSEIVPKGHVIGPTFSCLIGEHFAQVKYNDRYFYEHGGQPHSFTAAQLVEIKKASLARIFCDNSDQTVLSVQRKAFVAVNPNTNPRVSCFASKLGASTIPSLNLNPWKGEKLF